MSVLNLRGVDLNLLPVLRALLDERSVTAAARCLGMSQPATSSALNRLRGLLDDPLLVRTGRGMQLTPRAERLRPDVERACLGVERLLAVEAFDPRDTPRRFVVAAPDYMHLLIGSALMRRLAESAPAVSLKLITEGPRLVERVAAGEVDVAIVARSSIVEEGLRLRANFTDRLVGVVGVDHPLAGRPPADMAVLDAWPSIGAEVRRTMFGPNDPLWAVTRDADEKAVLSLSSLFLLPLIAARSQGVAIVPKALARLAREYVDLAWFDLPGPPALLEVCQIWSPLLDADAGHRWLRGLLDEVMSEQFAAR